MRGAQVDSPLSWDSSWGGTERSEEALVKACGGINLRGYGGNGQGVHSGYILQSEIKEPGDDWMWRTRGNKESKMTLRILALNKDSGGWWGWWCHLGGFRRWGRNKGSKAGDPRTLNPWRSRGHTSIGKGQIA